MIIAIDGPAASGKGTLAKLIGARYGLPVLDTGLLYRAVARDVVARRFRLEDRWAAAALAGSLDLGSLDDPNLRGATAGEPASIVARHPEVRRALLGVQRSFANQSPGAVLDGRDIGTVICPGADVKIFITAAPEVRARRRFGEFAAAGQPTTYETVLADILARDARDAGRGAAPLRKADDADLLDSTELDIEASLQAAVRLIERKISQSGCAVGTP